MARRQSADIEATPAVDTSDYSEDNSRAIQLGDFVVRVKNRFELGQVMDEKAVAFANTAYADAVRGTFYSKFKAATEEGKTEEEILSAFYAHEQAYEWNPRSRAPALTPLEKMEQKVAREWLQAAVAKQGRTIRGADPEVIERAIASVFEKRGEEIKAEANRRLGLNQAPVEVDFGDFSALKGASDSDD